MSSPLGQGIAIAEEKEVQADDPLDIRPEEKAFPVGEIGQNVIVFLKPVTYVFTAVKRVKQERMKKSILFSLIVFLLSGASIYAQSPAAEQAHQRNEIRKTARSQEKATAVVDRQMARVEREGQRQARQEAARVDRSRRQAATRERTHRHTAQTQAPGQRVRAKVQRQGPKERVRFGNKRHQPKRHRVGG